MAVELGLESMAKQVLIKLLADADQIARGNYVSVPVQS